MEFVRSNTLPVRIYGKDYELVRPTFKMAEIIMDGMGETVKDIKPLKAFVVACGVPQEIVEDMEFEHVSTLVEFLIPKKK